MLFPDKEDQPANKFSTVLVMSETKLNCLLATYYGKTMGLTNDSHVLRLSVQSLRPVNNHNQCYHCWLNVESSCARGLVRTYAIAVSRAASASCCT